MEFHLLRTNSGKLLGLLLASAISVLALIPGLLFLNKYNSFICAGAATILFFGIAWAFFWVLKMTQEPIGITISPTALIEVNQLTGVRRDYPFSGIVGYRFLPAFRGVATLRLILTSGERIKLHASDISLLDNSNRAKFELMVQVFKDAWERHQQGSKDDLAGS